MMNTSGDFVRTWVKTGVATGLLAFIVYPLLITVPMPLTLTVILAAAFGPLLSVASIGLYYFMSVHRRTVTLQIAVIFNVIAGTLLNAMLVIQMTLRRFLTMRLEEAADERARELTRLVYAAVDKVQLGLDISWDIYISVGTILFGLNMLRHPRLGRLAGGAGIVIGALLLSFNMAHFPVPPAEGGGFDAGPLIGVWYVVVAVLMLRSFKWLDAVRAVRHP